MIDSLSFLYSDRELVPTATIRAEPADFNVSEIPLIQPSGSGEHLWLQIRKTDVNTQQVAERLARALSLKPRNISFAGLKDRRAVTTQWFCATMPGKPDPDVLDLGAGVEVLEICRHQKKLRRGQLKGNHFQITLTDFAGDLDAVSAAFKNVSNLGVPNYFGEQRFGRAFGNLEKCLNFFAGTYKPRSRLERGLLISSARAFLFNHYVDYRLSENTWDSIVDGDVINLAGSQSVFVADSNDRSLQTRYDQGDIHITGPLFGEGASMALESAQKKELQVIQTYRDYYEGLVAIKANSARRPMRVIPWQTELKVIDKKKLRLEFSLPAGAYATTVLREFLNYSVAVA